MLDRSEVDPDLLRSLKAQSCDPLLTNVCGAVAILGAFILVAGTLVGGVVVPGHDPIADTVSDLAAGRYEWIQDVSLYTFAAGLLACGIGSADKRMDGRRWSAGIGLLALLSLCVTIIAARNEYGDGDNEGIIVHIYLVYALGAMFVLAPLAMARGLGRVWRPGQRLSIGIALFWVVGAPAFFLVPTSVDGLVERLLGVAAALWVCTIGVALLRRSSPGA